jgi:hypothetical protein
MYYDWIQKNRRNVIIGIGAFFALIIVWAVWMYVDRYGKTPLTISVVPSNAKVLINNQSLGNGTHWLIDGTYQVKVEREGFASQESSTVVTSKKGQNVLAFSLVPESAEAKKWAAEHPNDYKRNERYGAIAARTEGEYFSKNNPISTKLPFIDPYFTIGYRADGDGNSVVLTITTPSPRYRFYAVEKIRQLGYDPTDFVIEFKDFKNPLEQA